MNCGYRAGAGVIVLPVEVTTREPEGKRQPRCGDIRCKREVVSPGGVPRMLGRAGRSRCRGGAGGHGSPGNLFIRFGTMPACLRNSINSDDPLFVSN